MANDDKKAYPTIPTKHWWTLRERFKKSMPGTITANYLASVLGMSEVSARTNIQPPLRSLGLVDENDKPSDLAVKWRDDVQYPKLCGQLLKATYPQELLDIGIDRDAVKRWFANHTGAGQNAVGKMTALFLLLSEADPAVASASPPPSRPTRLSKSAKTVRPNSVDPKSEGREASKEPSPRRAATNEKPSVPLHINVQVHISSDSTPDQIDQIFASMAKHLYQND